MIIRQHSLSAIVFILDLLAILVPLLTDMYLPAPSVISAQLGVSAGSTQTTLSIYTLGFALGRLIYRPMIDGLERKPVVLDGTLMSAAAAVACALANTVDQLIVMCFFRELVTAATSVVISALIRGTYPREGFSQMMSSVMLVITIAPPMVPMAGGWVPMWLNWHYTFRILALTAVLAPTMIFSLIEGILLPECRQPLHICTTIDNFTALFRHKHVPSYMLISSFSFVGMSSFLGTRPLVYIEINHVALENLGYHFTLNIVFLFVMTIFNGRFVRRIGALNTLRSGLRIQFIMVAWMTISTLLGLGFWSLVVGAVAFVGCVSTALFNAMAVILDELPHMAGTVSSLAGTSYFGIGVAVGILLSPVIFNSAWLMIWSTALCVISSILFCLYASRLKKR